MRTKFRHDMSTNAVVGYAVRMGDNGGPLVALRIDDEAAGVRIGIRVRTSQQAKALVMAAELAAAELAAAELEWEEAPDVVPGLMQDEAIREARELIEAASPEILLDDHRIGPVDRRQKSRQHLGRRKTDQYAMDFDPDATISERDRKLWGNDR